MAPRSFRICSAVIAALLLAQPALAWNYVTHRIIAAIAYDRLNPAARARVDALLKQHPDYATMFLRDAPAEEPGRSRAAFIAAATWADQIRNDPRFYDEAAPDTRPTPRLPGFPDMQRHTGWHFIDLPFSQDGTALEPAAKPNIVTELERVIAEYGQPGPDLQQIYDLPWLIHMVGDINAPLHCVSRFSEGQPKGDQGGNLVFVSLGNTSPGVTLHKFWDDAMGTDASPAFVDGSSKELPRAYESGADGWGNSLTPEMWAQESLSIAKMEIYSFGPGSGTHDGPLALPAGYLDNTREVAKYKVVKAGFQLAFVLNRRVP
jgi:hypothetical protein